MSETYACTFVDCDKIFLKAYELKKHKVTHEAPDRVFYCPECDFYTLQKKNLRIHVATHTGEKIHLCPDMVTDDDSPGAPRNRCEYRTNDPAALTKHRKRAHGYIPPANRSRHTKIAPRKPHQKKGGKASQRPRLSPYPPSISCHKSKTPRILRPAYVPTCDAWYASTSTESSKESSPLSCEGNTRFIGSDVFSMSGYGISPSPFEGDACGQSTSPSTSGSAVYDLSPFLWRDPLDAYGQSMNLVPSIMSGPNPFVFSNFTSPNGHFESGTMYDGSLHPRWMAEYEQGYSSFDSTGLKYRPEPMPEVSAYPDFDAPTSMGCLCPEWMVESGVEGWDQQALNAYKDFHTF